VLFSRGLFFCRCCKKGIDPFIDDLSIAGEAGTCHDVIIKIQIEFPVFIDEFEEVDKVFAIT
jgi:hypothetical protein